ncbi:unnamed protein product [Echinostoma caproni]|uniref:Temptin n=1 Tax=Echinostoma caproni TaxID=27848 RepID=A0A183APL8_9TREM|nr:unnamed protein product [Echinostoma caproni]
MARINFSICFPHQNWTQLCRLDSDGDGLTNGQELGDPNCEWTKGQTPSRTTNLSHPGVCTPVNSLRCKHLHICAGLENSTGLADETHPLDIVVKYTTSDDAFFKTTVVLVVFLTMVKLIGCPELKYRIANGNWPYCKSPEV